MDQGAGLGVPSLTKREPRPLYILGVMIRPTVVARYCPPLPSISGEQPFSYGHGICLEFGGFLPPSHPQSDTLQASLLPQASRSCVEHPVRFRGYKDKESSL